MSFDLDMLNLWIGMCRGVVGLPKDLRKLGYEERGIEYTFANQDLEKVSPDLILASRQQNHTLLFEFKSGANTEADQLRRYSRVSRDDLIKRALIDRNAAQNHDITIVGQSRYGDRLQTGLVNEAYPFPLLLADEDGLALSYGDFSTAALNKLFSPKLLIDLNRIPSRFVPLDRNSESWEVAEVVIPRILAYMTERRPRVDLEQICRDICNTWSIMGKPGKNLFRAKVQDVLAEAAQSHFKGYLRWIRKKHLEIDTNPLHLDTDKRGAAFRKLKTAQKIFMDFLRKNQNQQKLPFFCS